MSIVEEGLYVIESAVEGALAIGVVPFIYPPPTVPGVQPSFDRSKSILDLHCFLH